MATSEERLKILKMIQEGKISAEEGLQLMEALEETIPEATQSTDPAGTAQAKTTGRWFRVRVTDSDTGKVRVNVRLPVGVVSAGLKMGMRFAPQVEGMDLDALGAMIASGEVGQIVDVMDDKDGEHVEVFIE